MIKNTAGQFVAFQLLAATDGSNVTTGSPTVYLTKDGGTQASGAGTVAHEGNGQWSYACTQADTDADHVAFTIVLADSISQTVNLYPKVASPTATQISEQIAADIENDDNGWDTALYNIVDAYMLTLGIASQTKQDEIIADLVAVETDLDKLDTILANQTDINVAPLYRDVTDESPIYFSWHAETPTPTVTVSIDGGAFVAIEGTVTPTLPDISGPGEYFFQISHDPADRPTAPGTAIYLMTDGIITDYVILNVVEYSVSFGGDGDFSITIPIINETTSAAIAGARVTLLTEAGVTTSATATTGTSGIVVLRADPGDYLIAVTPPAGYSAPDNTEITVAADLVVPAIELAGSIIPPASDPAKTNLAVDVKDQHGSPVVGAIVSAVLHCDGKLIAGGMITNVERTFTTDVDGRAVVPVIRATQFDAAGGEYEISVRTRGKTAKANYTATDLDADQLVVTIV